MGKVLFSVTMSLGGFMAGPGGDMSWMTEYLAPNPAVDDIVSRIGALLVGRRTFGGDDPHRATGSWTARASSRSGWNACG